MAEGVLNKIILWALLIIFLLIFLFAFYSPQGFISKIANLALGAERFLPLEPKKEIKANEQLSQEAIDAQEKLMQEFSNYADKDNCTLSLSSLSKLGDLRIDLSNDNGITSRIEKPVGKEGGVKLNIVKKEGLTFCVLDPKAFYDCYLGKQNKDCTKTIYDEYEAVQLTKDKIIIGTSSHSLGEGILFKPTKDRVCFVPVHSGFLTWFGCEAKEYTLDNDCIKLMQKAIKPCSAIK